MKTIALDHPQNAVSRLLTPFVSALTPASARRIANFRADDETQKRIAELAEKCSEGTMSVEERLEYEAYVRAIDVISILQSKARTVISKSRKK